MIQIFGQVIWNNENKDIIAFWIYIYILIPNRYYFEMKYSIEIQENSD